MTTLESILFAAVWIMLLVVIFGARMFYNRINDLEESVYNLCELYNKALTLTKESCEDLIARSKNMTELTEKVGDYYKRVNKEVDLLLADVTDLKRKANEKGI